VKQEVIAQRLAVLLACVDTGPTSVEPKGFALMLLTHIGDTGIGYLALESGCREIEANKKRIHSVAEVLEVLKAHEEQWGERRWTISHIENDALCLQVDIEKAQQRLEREREQAKVTQAAYAFDNRLIHLVRLTREITAKQDAAREMYRQIERAMTELAEQRRRVSQASAALREAQRARAELADDGDA
jgi:DNA repair exonuclease SbcCD ATPase subunit